MKVQGSPFYFGHQVRPAAAQFGPFFAWLQTLPQSTPWPPHVPHSSAFAYRRELFCNTLSDVFCGVILSARSTDFHHYINRNGSNIRVEAREIGSNPPVEVNFFCLRKDSCKGLYSHYHGSYSFGNFLSHLWGAYRLFVEQQRDLALRGIEDDEDQAATRRLYSLRNRAKYAPIYNQENFEALVRQLTQLYEVRMTSYEVDAPSDAPVSNRIKNVHQVFRLVDNQRADRALLDWLKQKRDAATRRLQSGRTAQSGSVVGVGTDGRERTIFFEDTLDDMLNFDYDDIGSFDVTNLSANPCLSAMIATVRRGVMFRPG
jgi:hypothetical protein